MLFTYVFGTDGRGTRSHHRVCWPYHASKHMAHSIQRRMLGNVTEITILVFIAAVQAAVQLHVSNAASMKAQWAHAAPALHTHRFCAAHAPLMLAVWRWRNPQEKKLLNKFFLQYFNIVIIPYTVIKALAIISSWYCHMLTNSRQNCKHCWLLCNKLLRDIV